MIIKLGQETAEIRRKVKFYNSGAHGTRAEKAGTRTAEIILEIDLEAIRRNLGRKALSSNGRKSKLQGGEIVARVVKGTEKENITPHVHGDDCRRGDEIICGH